MDISKPLPDVPSWEPFRDRDPVSAEYDRKNDRPKDYWKNTPMEQAEAMKRQSKQAGVAFPWGATREQALATGWQPSGFGEAVYGEDKVVDLQTGT